MGILTQESLAKIRNGIARPKLAPDMPLERTEKVRLAGVNILDVNRRQR